jgi:hypothetical protein
VTAILGLKGGPSSTIGITSKIRSGRFVFMFPTPLAIRESRPRHQISVKLRFLLCAARKSAQETFVTVDIYFYHESDTVLKLHFGK